MQQVKDLEGKCFLRLSRILSEPHTIRTNFLSEPIALSAAEKEQRTGQHAAELQRKDQEIAELKQGLAEAQKDLQELAKVEKNLRGSHRRTKESLECTSNVLKDLQAEAKEWRKFLTNMDAELSSKFGSNPRRCTSCFLRRFYLRLLRFFAGSFPDSDARAQKAVSVVRNARIQEGPISIEWTIEDYLVSLKAWLGPIKRLGSDVLTTMLALYRALWPGAPQPTTV